MLLHHRLPWCFLLLLLLCCGWQPWMGVRAGSDNPNQYPPQCPIQILSRTKGEVETPTNKKFQELSGVSVSSTQRLSNGDPIFYAMGDRGSGSYVGIWNGRTGQLIRRLQVEANNVDWEDMTLGPCGIYPVNTTQQCLYIADIGDNEARHSKGRKTARKEGVRILKYLEPRLEDYPDDDMILWEVQRLYLDYRKSPNSPTDYADAEAIFIDPTTPTTVWRDGDGSTFTTTSSNGDMYIITKWDKPEARLLIRLFEIPASAWGGNHSEEDSAYGPTAVEASGLMGRSWTRAELSPDGTLVALGASDSTYIFLRCPGMSVADALMEAECFDFDSKLRGDGKPESLAFRQDGQAILQFPEGHNPTMEWSELKFDPSQGLTCGGGPSYRRAKSDNYHFSHD
jgi:hypothetical protein